MPKITSYPLVSITSISTANILLHSSTGQSIKILLENYPIISTNIPLASKHSTGMECKAVKLSDMK